MSSDGFFDDTFDDDALQQLDAIEAAAFGSAQPQPSTSKTTPPVSPTRAQRNGSFYDLTLDLDEDVFQQLDEIEITQGTRTFVSSSRTSSRDAIQLNLHGEPVPPPAGPSKPRSGMHRTTSSSRNPFGQQAPKTKKWDQTAFAKTGLKQPKTKGKPTQDEDEDMEEAAPEFDEFPAPFISIGPPPPMKLVPDLLEAKHWIYPTNRPKRDYQYNIVKRCLFDNTVVALPTGLGKTFIAGVVMLNFYRWFPQGKVVFVAPTKPLVAQQIDACHQTCGIPGCDAIELTGNVHKNMRHNAWKTKRVFYMTPQTLINDLTKDNCDPRDIILLVIDEAHRATGNYAYNQIVRFLMAKNPHFRLLALTATPGANPDAVQTLVDGLHISRIEIRDENSLDLKQYLHHKKIEQHIIPMNDSITTVQGLLSKLIEDSLNPLVQRGLWFYSRDPMKIHPYSAQAKMGDLRPDQRWAFPLLSNLAILARAMGYLVEGTMGMCYTSLKGLTDPPEEADDKAHKKAKAWRDNTKFQALMQQLESEKLTGFPIHPKMEKMNEILADHFEDPSVDPDTRVMVFVTFREAVDEIVSALNTKRPLIRAMKFVGQGTDKQGRKGLLQREQLEVIKKFKAGEFNVLVATAIGEEGLDIGEVDMIACYDSQKTPIRMLQRLGRTGRKRDGVVHILLAEGREETNFEKAKMTYKEVQKTIVRGDQLELYGDVERLLPEHIKPECLEKMMEIQEYVRDERRVNPSAQTGKKRKRNDDIMRNIPKGAATEFKSVAELVKGQKKRKLLPEKDFDEAGEDDDDDKELELGLTKLATRRTKSSSAATKSPKKKGRVKRAATMDGTEKKKSCKKGTKKKDAGASRSPTPFSQCVYSDDDDMEIKRGFTSARSLLRQSTPPPPKKKPSTLQRSPPKALSPEPQISQEVIELTDSDGDILTYERDVEFGSSFPQPILDEDIAPLSPKGETGMAWLLDDDDDLAFEIRSSSPPVPRHPRSPQSEDASIEIVEYKSAASATFAFKDPQESSVTLCSSASPKADGAMELSSPIPRPIRRKRNVAVDVDSPSFTMPPPSQRRLHRKHESSSPLRADTSALDSEELIEPSRKKTRKKSRLLMHRHQNPFFNVAADHSGDEVSEGSSGEEELESESDMQFLQELPASQASPSYNQTQVYRQSLFTQAPGKGLAFSSRPVRQGAFGHGFRLGARRSTVLSRSPTPEMPDEYAYGSFVVADDADISYIDDSTEL